MTSLAPSSATPGVRHAVETDIPLMVRFIRDLAEYEKLLHTVTITDDLLYTALFGARPYAEALIGSLGDEPAGFALFFHTFSTFVGKPGLYLEDLYVHPHLRGRGVGKGLLRRVAQIAVERDCGRMEWSVLDWNAPSIAFYQSLGAKPLDDWTMYRLTGDALARVAGQP